MTTRPFACALVGAVLLSCGARPDLLEGSPGGTGGGVTHHHPAATVHDAGLAPDANVTAGAEGGAAAANAAAGGIAGLLEAARAPSSSPQMQEACVNIDLSTFDRSCHADSDCMSIAGGMACPTGCFCPNTAINVDDRQRYETTIASLPFTVPACPCPSGRPPACTQGVCN